MEYVQRRETRDERPKIVHEAYPPSGVLLKVFEPLPQADVQAHASSALVWMIHCGSRNRLDMRTRVAEMVKSLHDVSKMPG